MHTRPCWRPWRAPRGQVRDSTLRPTCIACAAVAHTLGGPPRGETKFKVDPLDPLACVRDVGGTTQSYSLSGARILRKNGTSFFIDKKRALLISTRAVPDETSLEAPCPRVFSYTAYRRASHRRTAHRVGRLVRRGHARREDQKVGAWDRPRTADVSRLGRGSISAALHRSHRGKASRDESTVISQNHASILRRRRQLLRLRLLRRRVLRLRRFRLRRLRLRRWR